MALWSTSNTALDLHGAHHGYEFADPFYGMTFAERHIRGAYDYPDSPVAGTTRVHGGSSRSETETTGSVLPSEATTEVAEEASEMSKLKGLVWPGMDLFDSATPEMKRKRNQRKDGSVLELMKSASASVEPTEFVWGSDGGFQRTRYIYASPSIDGSPVN